MFYIGCHLTISNGFRAMAEQAVSLGANTMQFFTRNPRGGNAKAIDPADVAAFQAFAAENGIGVIVGHAAYTLNLCSADPGVRSFARDSLAGDVARMEQIPGQLYNFHPGSHVGQGIDTGIDVIADALNGVLTQEQTTTVLLEAMSGKGSEVGGRFAELRAIIDRVELSDKLGVCLDTCHVYDAGYDIVGDLDGVLGEFDAAVGIGRLRAVHLNDSKNPMGSHKDRHEKIGLGHIGTAAFERIINHPALRDLPFILETPHEDDSGYAEEIALLKGLRK